MSITIFLNFRASSKSWSLKIPSSFWSGLVPSTNFDRSQNFDHFQIDDYYAARYTRSFPFHLQQHHVYHGSPGECRSWSSSPGPTRRSQIFWKELKTFYKSLFVLIIKKWRKIIIQWSLANLLAKPHEVDAASVCIEERWWIRNNSTMTKIPVLWTNPWKPASQKSQLPIFSVWNHWFGGHRVNVLAKYKCCKRLLVHWPNNYLPNGKFLDIADTNLPAEAPLCNQTTRAQFDDIANKNESWLNSVREMHSVSACYGNYLFPEAAAANDPRYVGQISGHLKQEIDAV